MDQRQGSVVRTPGRRAAILVAGLAVLLLCSFTGGCSFLPSQAGSRQPSFEQMLSAPYDQTRLKESLTLDVLPHIQRAQGQLAPYFMGAELLSQSENVVASSGQAEDGHRIWFNMVAFHEFKLNVIRKYFFVVDDTGPNLRGKPRHGLRFDCEMVLPEELSVNLGTDENARQIAVLRYILSNLHTDINGLDARGEAVPALRPAGGPSINSGQALPAAGNKGKPVPSEVEGTPSARKQGQNDKTLAVCSMLINQTFEIILRKVDASPALAQKLSGANGLELDHITFDKGSIRMAAGGDTAAVKIRFGIFQPPSGDDL